MALDILPKQISLLHHTLGVTPERREPYRNHFVAGPGHHDQVNLEALEAAGLMERAPAPKFLDQADVVFRVTTAGRAYALEHLAPAPKRTKYDDYLHSESSLSFAEWLLGWAAPEMETDYYTQRSGKYRMKSSKATGEWKAAKKEAKASYKEALRAHRELTVNFAKAGGAL